MNVALTQETRTGRLQTTLGGDALVALGATIDEHVNGLFKIRIEALAHTNDIDFDTLLETEASLTLSTIDHPDEVFSGVITKAQFGGVGENGWRYGLTLRPWLWMAGLRRNQRIFHQKSVVDILDDVFSPYSHLGQPAVRNTLTGSFPQLEYTVQYRESDLAFATRLMERFGISYFFEHTANGHTLVLADAVTSLDPIPGGHRRFQQVGEDHRGNEEALTYLAPSRRMTTNAIRLMDFNFKKPLAAMDVDHADEAPYSQSSAESFDYPGDYLEQDDGKDVVKLRVKQERGQDARHYAAGNCTSLRPGRTLDIKDAEAVGLTGTCLCLSARHSFISNAGSAGGTAPPSYEGTYTMMPADAPFAPVRITPIPVVHGPQTATVVGEGEIDCDEFGRILVHFPWDTEGANSMRCRVSQNWAGNGFGGMVIPRIGMEVVVEFLEGNPDKPLVSGCVYNGKNDPPYPLPANKTRSTFKTDTHQGNGHNELRFEDKDGAEEIYIHAQMNRRELTLHNHSETINNDWGQTVGRDKVIQVARDHTENIGKDMELNIAENRKESVGINFETTVGAVHDMTIGTNAVWKVGSNSDTEIGASSNLTIGANETISIGSNSTESVGQNKVINIGDQLTITVGSSRLIMKSDGSISFIGNDFDFQASGDVTVNSAKDFGVKASSKIILKGSKIDMN